jgi:mannose-1-phosphate guanylyltransferase
MQNEAGLLKTDLQSTAQAGTQGGPVSAWALILAGGNGDRLRSLTLRVDGDSRPKQFSRIYGRRTLLEHTRARLCPIFPDERTLFVVTKDHEPFYREHLADAEEERVLVQPENRGTGIAIILGLIRVLWRDPDAVVAVFPSDHFFQDDAAFRTTVRAAVAAARRHTERLVLVGVEPRGAEVEYGWIETGDAMSKPGDAPLFSVRRFWEKPRLEKARELMETGGLWNTFITVGHADAFLELLASTVPATLAKIVSALARRQLDDAYRTATTVDFSRDVLTRAPHRLLVLRDAASGWTDLGNALRVLETLADNGIEPDWLRKIRRFRGQFEPPAAPTQAWRAPIQDDEPAERCRPHDDPARAQTGRMARS